MDEWSQYLKSERLRRGLSLQEAAHKAELSIGLLKALEQGQFPDIGSPALVRSLLLAYSRALGISQLPSTAGQAPHATPVGSTSPVLPQPQGSSVTTQKIRVLRLAALGLIALLAVGVCYQIDGVPRPDREHSASQPSDTRASVDPPVPSEMPSSVSAASESKDGNEKPSNPSENGNPPAAQGTGVTAQQEGEQKPPAAVSAVSTEVEESAASRPPVSPYHRFEVEAFQASWVEVKPDGRKTEGFLLRPGEKREWQEVQELQILVGNAGGVQVKWDGTPVNHGGRPGQVLRMRLPHPNLTGKSP